MHLYIEPNAGTQPVVQVIEDARKSVDLNVYYLSDKQILRALHAAARRGVEVRVMLDRHPYRMRRYKIEREYREVEATGAKVKFSPDRFRYDHAKYVCSLSRCEIGTANYSWSAFHRNREYLLTSDATPVVQAARAVFNADWHETRAGTAPRRVLVLSPGSTAALVEAIRQPGPVDIEQEELDTDRPIMRALRDGGDRIRLILPHSAERADRQRIRELRQSGVRIRFMPRSTYMHAKLILGRHMAFVGSENFSWNSLNHNREMGLLFNGSPLEKARRQFDHDWRQAS
ncbi:hypothetical protein BJI67_16170 (plasmid) [Acidihalobacter aeolianus]|uniref:phospholipase D n=1 Tax=Acidihalobacter aeolianus TaxID=2792603 RepID=A0A1D8KCT9_9GAMM|nr:phospholipase D-like domain-containing protein [Acidihalobacter aeolianus]AOV18775.1 hypothetical protein BJI67_16170 [Acidihalobacter aeolianus]